MSPYALLGLSVLFEVFGDTCMKLSEGFKRKLPIIGIVVGYAVSFYSPTCRWAWRMRSGRARLWR